MASYPSWVDPLHPVALIEYAIYTPPTEEMITTIGDWIDQRISGGYIYGPSRYGKSRAVKWHVRNVLHERFKMAIPLVVWIRRESAMSEGEFWNSLLAAAKFEFHDPLQPKTKTAARFLFEQLLITVARSARCNYVVLIIDEAHAMTLREWNWLLGLQNVLDEQGFRLTTISIGSHGLLFQQNYLTRTGNSHICARFFACDVRFNGIGSEDQLGYVLNGYDVDSEWPKKSGQSYLQYFAPDYFKAGQRFKNHGSVIWTAFMDLRPPNIASNKKIPKEIPMQHLAHSIEQALRRLAGGEEWAKVMEYKSWLGMIEKTGFTKHMQKLLVNA